MIVWEKVWYDLNGVNLLMSLEVIQRGFVIIWTGQCSVEKQSPPWECNVPKNAFNIFVLSDMDALQSWSSIKLPTRARRKVVGPMLKKWKTPRRENKISPICSKEHFFLCRQLLYQILRCCWTGSKFCAGINAVVLLSFNSRLLSRFIRLATRMTVVPVPS